MQNRKVTVIDDDKQFLGEFEENLAMAGYVPVVVSDPLLVMDTIVHSRPDVILFELRMPQKKGFEITDTINRFFQTSRMPIIAMSAFLRDESRWLFDCWGIKQWLKKPFCPLDAIWAIENAVANVALRAPVYTAPTPVCEANLRRIPVIPPP